MLWRCKEPERNPLSNGSTSEVLIDNEDKPKSALRANGSRRYRPQSVRQRWCILKLKDKVWFSAKLNVSENTNIRLYSWASWISRNLPLKVNHSPATEEAFTTAKKMIGCTQGRFRLRKIKETNIHWKGWFKGVIIADAVLFLPN
jgi:hypothetical protein